MVECEEKKEKEFFCCRIINMFISIFLFCSQGSDKLSEGQKDVQHVARCNQPKNAACNKFFLYF